MAASQEPQGSEAQFGAQGSGAQVSEAQIAVHWREEEYYYPPPAFVAQANAADPAIFERFTEDKFPDCFTEYADLLTWDAPWHTTLDTSNAPFWKWFTGGRLNASYNCVDRHAAASPDKTAIIFVPEPESDGHVEISYAELHRQVNEFAAVLRDSLGLKAGDRVTLHMPMVPELPVTMLACARLGVIHSQVFGGFSGTACGHRIADSGSRILITMDGYYRAGQLADHKVKADEAVAAARQEGQEVDKVLVWRRHPGQYASQTPMIDGRDVFVDELLAGYRGQAGGAGVDAGRGAAVLDVHLRHHRPPEGLRAQHRRLPGLCGRDVEVLPGHPPRRRVLVHGRHRLDHRPFLHRLRPAGTGHHDGDLRGRAQLPRRRPARGGSPKQLGVNIFHTSPTAIRMLRKVGPEEPKKYDYHFKHMTTVGEPIEPEVWRWYHSEVGKGEAAIVDTWWQTENGGFLGSTLPALQPMKPGSCGPGVLGVYPVIYDEDGNQIPAGSGKAGNICIRNPWPGIFQTIWGQPERFVDTYYAKYNTNPDSTDWRDWPYFAGDGAVQAADGYFRILGRVDDVINVAGHRLGTKEIESAALTVPEVAEAAAVPVIDDIRGRVVEIYVSLKPGFEPGKEMEGKVSKAIETEIGKIARPKNVWIVPDMPKTRSGKIMRRVIASISNFADVGDVTTLANPEIVDDIRHHVQSAKVAKDDVPRELTEAEFEEIKKFGGE